MFRTRALSYAIMSATEVAQQDGNVLAYEIASKYELPKAYVGKIMSQMAKARLLQSDRGPTGGFHLARPANKITLLEIFEVVNGQLGDGRLYDVPGALGKTVATAVGKANDGIRRVLGGVHLSDIIKK